MDRFDENSLLANDNVIIDETGTSSYKDIVAAFGRFDRLLEKNGRRVECVCLPQENSRRFIALFAYFFSRGITVCLQNGVSDPPAFCDAVVHLVKPPPGDGIGTSFDVRPNENHRSSATSQLAGGVILNTSGSTGKRKYVYYRADKLISNATNAAHHFQVTRSSRMFIPVPVGHMFGFGVGLLPALCRGAHISVVERANVVKLLDRLGSFRPTLTLTTPTMLKMLVQLGRKKRLETLFISAGDRLTDTLYHKFTAGVGDLVNLYGSTELGAVATSRLSGTGDKLSPLRDVKVVIEKSLDHEILVEHPSAFEFYLDENGVIRYPELISSRYRTKDIGETAADFFRVLGRLDTCINRSGFLVPLEEIEKKLENLFPELNQVVTFESAGETAYGGTLVALCEAPAHAGLTSELLYQRARSIDPKHFAPDEFHIVTDIPRLGNGKVNRSALPAFIGNVRAVGHGAKI